jgi:hypothetical protein
MTQSAKGKFIQVPNIFLDTCELPETFQIGYLRLIRLYGRKKIFVGSIRKLSNAIRISKSTVARMIPAWVSEGLVNKKEENGVLILEILIDDLWEKNKECPKLGQDEDEGESATVPNRDKSVPQWDDSVPNRDKSVPPLSVNYPPYTSNTNKTDKILSASQDEDAAHSSAFEKSLDEQPNLSLPERDEFANETSEVNRSTNAPTPSSSVQVKRDEPLRRIEAETQEQTPALPVVETQKDIPIDNKARNNANIPIAHDSEKTAEKKPFKRSSKTKQQQPVADLTPEEQARIAEEKAKEEARAERHRDVLAKIIARRGFALEDRQDVINEHRFINKLMDKYTDAQIDRIHRYLMEEDWKWSKVDNKFTIGAYIIWKESSRVAQTLRDRREQSLKDQREGVHRKTAVEAGTLPPQTRQPKNVIEAPKDWVEKRAAGGK